MIIKINLKIHQSFWIQPFNSYDCRKRGICVQLPDPGPGTKFVFNDLVFPVPSCT